MSGHDSYPSPISTSTSPAMNDDSAPSTLSRVAEEAPARNHTDTQRSLQQASAALEAAYRRIRQVRRNLLEMTDSFSAPEPTRRRAEDSGIGPDHEVITLTDSTGNDPGPLNYERFDERLEMRPGSSPGTMMEERLRQFETRIDNRGGHPFRDLPLLNTPGPTHAAPPSNTNSPGLPNRTYPLPRRSQLETQLSRRRESYMDEAATSIGRRVAAREAAGSSNTGSSSFGPFNSTPGSSAIFASIERDIEHFRTIARQRRTEPPLGARDNPRLSDPRASRTVDPNTRRRGTYVPSLLTGAEMSSQPSLGPQPESRRRMLTGAFSSPISSQSERLSLLSNFSNVQNLTTPVSAGIPRPLLFDEPSSYIPAANFVQQTPQYSDTIDDFLTESNEQRNYIIRRTFNADGEEHIHPVNLDWPDDDESSWFVRSLQDDPTYDYSILRRDGAAPPRNRARRETAQAALADSVASGPQRRRGWARLDPDGNEIPSDEEEELERVRAEYRIQAQSRPRAPRVVPMGGIDARPAVLHALHAPTTSASLMPDDDDVSPDGVPRVRLGPRDVGAVHGSVMDSVMTVDSLRRGMSSASLFDSVPARPFCANPLPMPLEEMVWTAPKTKHSRLVRIPKYASLAGR